MNFMNDIISNPIAERIIKTAIIILTTFIFWKIASLSYKRFISRKINLNHLDKNTNTIARTILSVVRFIVVFAIVLLVLQINGINVSSLIAGLGIISAIVGLALQDYLKDIIMGFHILTDDFYKIGDVIKYNGDEGEVIAFTLRNTKIRSLETSNIITISNRNVASIEKFSEQSFLDLTVSNKEETARIDEILTAFCTRISDLPAVQSCTYIGIEELNRDSTVYRLTYQCAPIQKRECRRTILRLLQEELTTAKLSLL